MIRPASRPPGPLEDRAAVDQTARAAAGVPTKVEWFTVVVTLFVLTRSPVLFVRQRTMTEVGGAIGPFWQDDALIRGTFLAFQLVVCALAVRRCSVRPLVRHLGLIALLVLALVSVGWSVEPSVTLMRALLFTMTAGVGWFLGTRFSLVQQLDVVVAAGAIGVVGSLLALVRWPQLARSTNGVLGEWSGVYVNRNLLAVSLCVTLLAALLRFTTARRWHRGALIALAIPALWLLDHSGARTGPVSLAAAVGVAGVASIVGVALVRRGVPLLLSSATFGAALVAGLVTVDRQQDAVLAYLGREPTLTRRTEMWEIDRAFLEVRPWRGWGFEAIWSHPPAINAAASRFDAYPYQAHNGYFEMALSLGRVGLMLLVAVIVLTMVRCVALAWQRPTSAALWPLAIATFSVVANFSESLFVANDALWALFVSAGVAAVSQRAEVSRGRAGEGSPGSHAARSTPSDPR